MSKETLEGKTMYCEACEAQSRATPEALELIEDMKHSCGKDHTCKHGVFPIIDCWECLIDTNPLKYTWGR